MSYTGNMGNTRRLSKGRRVTEGEIDARTPDDERKRWRGKLLFDTNATTDEIVREILRTQEGKSERSS